MGEKSCLQTTATLFSFLLHDFNMLKPLRTITSYFCSISPPFPYLYREKPTNLEDLSISGITSVSSADKCQLTLDNSEEDSKRIDNMLPVIIHLSLQVTCMT